MFLPGPVRKIIAVIRGEVAPPLIFLATLLGFWFGIIPGFSGIHFAVIIIVLLLNIPLGLFLISVGIGEAICYAAAPVLYHLGIWVHSYLDVLLRILSAVPIIGLTDFNKFAVNGALLLGPAIGVPAGLILAYTVTNFRKMVLKFEQSSEQFKKWHSKWGVRILDRLLISRRARDYKSLFTSKIRYIRKTGLILVCIIVILGFILSAAFTDTSVRNYLAAKLTQTNGAEVNLAGFDLSIPGSAVSASGIQVTNPEQPEKNQVAIEKLAADISAYNLLIGKLVMDSVEVSNVTFDEKRKKPGKITEKQEEKQEVPETTEVEQKDIKTATLEKYLKNAQALKKWLHRVKKWLPRPEGKTVKKREIPQQYLAYLTAEADVPPSPRILAKKAVIDKVRIPAKVFGNSRIILKNISDAARTAHLPVSANITSYDTPARLDITLDYSKDNQPNVHGKFEGLKLGALQSGLNPDAGLEFDRGTASGTFTGRLNNQFIDVTVKVNIDNLQANAKGDGVLGLGTQRTSEVFKALNRLDTTIRLVGPVSEPKIAFDIKQLEKTFKEALVKAGKEKLSDEIDKQIEKQLGDKATPEVKELQEKSKDLIKGLFGEKKDEGEK